MMTIRGTGRTAWLASAALVAASVAGVSIPRVRAQGAIPPGSWQETCTLNGIDTAKGLMSAACGKGNGYDLDLYFNEDFRYSDCSTPISNYFGRLSCVEDQAKVAARLKQEQAAQAAAQADAAKAEAAAAQLKYQLELNEQIAAATPGLRAAAVIVLGRDLGNEDIRKLGVAARSLAYPEARAAMFAKEFDFGTAAAFLKKYLARSSGEPYRNDAVDLAFQQVYGRASTPGEQVDYYNRISAGQAWYATIVADQMKSIAPGEHVRAGIAHRVAEMGYGRDPDLAELKQWTGSGQNFGTMVEGVRQTLWQGGNADPLILTVSRALAKLGRPSDDAGVKATIAAWRPLRPVYAEMIGPIGKAKLGNGRPPALRR